MDHDVPFSYVCTPHPGAGSATDSPDTARAAVLSLHSSWVRWAGGVVECDDGVEVSPLVSYAGEGLEAACSGRRLTSSYDSALQGRQS